MKPYRTVLRRAEDEFIINKSRFIGHAAPCSDEKQALEFIADMRQRYKDASHNCYAYVIGQNKGIMRYSDDGEPGGTAGLPMMEVLKNRDVTDLCVVVTRYFGGVLLGAGGLVRAYAQGSKAALDAAGVVVMERSARHLVEVDYSTWQRLEYFLRSAPVIIEHMEFGASVVCTLMVRKRDEEALLAEITRVTDARAETLPDGELYYPWPDEG